MRTVRSVIFLLGSLLLALVASMCPSVPRAQARPAAVTGLSVSLGYADSLRAKPTQFPSPWLGSPNVIFEGCQPPANCSYDAGAIQITNTGVSAHTINSVVVKLDTCAYALWPNDISLPAGDTLILTQMVSGATSGCTRNGLFDTSDVGPGGVGWSGHCTTSGIKPEVDITVDQVLQTITDSGQILNTKGIDVAPCGLGNESTQWTPAGNVGCPTAELAIAPATQSYGITTQAVVTATLTNSCGNPLQNVAVSFAVSSGPSAGKTASATTDANGNAQFGYSSSAIGTDTISATVSNLAGTIASSSTAAITWVNHASLNVTPETGSYNVPAQVNATLTAETGAPIAGAPITFTVGSQSCGPVMTSADGLATCAFTPTQQAGTYPIRATYPGDAAHVPAQNTGTFTVIRAKATAHYTGATQLTQGGAATLRGRLVQDSGSMPIAGRTLTLSSGSDSCTAQTDATGTAACTIPTVETVPGASDLLTASFPGDAYYGPSTDVTSGTVVAPSGSANVKAGSGAPKQQAGLVVPLDVLIPLIMVILGVLGSILLFVILRRQAKE